VVELICVRHGRTGWNVDRRFQGQTDIPLDDRGRAQAQAVAASLRGEAFDLAVSSDLGRAVETAQTILREHPGTPLRLDRDLREMAFGTWEGLTWAQIVEGDAELALEREHRPRSYAPPQGESFDLLVERTQRAIERIVAELPDGGRALVVTHAGILHALLPVILGQDEGEALQVRFAPASVSRFAVPGVGKGRLLSLNRVVAGAS
jgi:broad specificity phosphatase PhoE